MRSAPRDRRPVRTAGRPPRPRAQPTAATRARPPCPGAPGSWLHRFAESKCGEHAAKHDREAFRWIVSPVPSSSGAKLLVRGLEALQVDMVLAVRPVVSCRIELEVDLIE